MDLSQLQHYASMAVSFDEAKNFEAAKYFYLQAAALINDAVANNLIRLQVKNCSIEDIKQRTKK